MDISLLGKRYVELEPTITIGSDILLAVYKAGEPELNKITFQNFQRSISLKNTKDLQGKILSNGHFLKYDLATELYSPATINASDVADLPIQKIIDLEEALNGKEPVFPKGNIVSTTLQLQNNMGRLVGSANLEIEINQSFYNLQQVTTFGNTTTNRIYINNPRGLYISTTEDGTFSNNVFVVQNNSGGGMFLANGGRLTIRSRGDSTTGYAILRLQDNSSTPNTVWEVRGGGVTSGGDAINENDYITLKQLNDRVGRILLDNSSVFNRIGNIDSIRVRGHSGTITGLPGGLGGSVSFHIASNDETSSRLRNFSIYRTYNTESWYLGAPTSGDTIVNWRLIWHSGNLAQPMTLDTNQVVTGVKYFRRGSASGELLHTAFDYPDNNGDDYHLRLYNDGSGNNIRWYFKQKVILGVNSVVLDLPVIGFKNGVTMIGALNNPLSEIETYYNSQTNPATRYPLVMYTDGDAMFNGRIYTGKNNFTDTSFLTASDSLYSEGTVYAKAGLRTPEANNNSVLNGSTWYLGEASADSAGTHTHKAFVKINGIVYKVLLEETEIV